MGIFNKFKKPEDNQPAEEKKSPVKAAVAKKPEKPSEKKVKVEKKTEMKSGEIKGKTTQAYRVLIKPLVTEKATDLGVLNKYIFAINPKMNKVEVKKAIRTVYKVEPIKVNISNFSGRKVRYGRVSGTTKSWKKAIVTLKEGDKIEVYEGV